MIRILRFIQVVIVIATACSFVAIFTVTAATDVQLASVTCEPTEASSVAKYTIVFHIGAEGALSAGVDTINIVFPTGTNLPSSISSNFVSIDGIEPHVDPKVSGQMVALVTPINVANGSLVTISIAQAANIVNPKIASNNYKVQTFTSREPALMGSNAYIITPYFSICPVFGPRNASVAVTGNGWTPNQSIEIRGALNGTGTALADGTFSLSASTTNSGIVTCIDGSGWGSPNSGAGNIWNIAEPMFDMTPMLQITPTSGNRGTYLTVRGYDFTTGSFIPANGIRLAGIACSPAESVILQTLDSYGILDDFVTTLTVPSNITCGVSAVSATDANGETGTTTFTIEPLRLKISPYSGPAGTPVTISGSGFAAGDIIAPSGITIGSASWNTEEIHIDSYGNWTAVLTVPATAPVGNSAVVITTKAGSTLTIPFIVSTITGEQPTMPDEVIAHTPVLISTPATTVMLNPTPIMTPIPTSEDTPISAPMPGSSPSPTITPTLTPTPTPMTIAAPIAPSKPPEDGGFSLTNKPSSDPGVIGTNIGLALFTVLVFYLAATIFNNTMKENYRVIQGRLDRSPGPHRYLSTFAQKGIVSLRRVMGNKMMLYVESTLVILLCALVYTFLEPYFINFLRHFALFLSLVIGILIATSAYEGTQVLVSVRTFGVPAAVKLYPIAVLIAIIFVAISRNINFHPGLIYGFVGTYTALSFSKSRRLNTRQQAITILLGILVILAVSIIAFLLIQLVKNHWGGEGFVKMLVDDILVAAVAIGLEGLLFSIALPVTFMDGKKIKDWNFSVWLACSGIVVFAFYEMIINYDHRLPEAVKSMNVQMMFGLMGLSLLLSGVIWLYFRIRRYRWQKEFQPEETNAQEPSEFPYMAYKIDEKLRSHGIAKQTSVLSKEAVVEQRLMLPDIVYKQDENAIPQGAPEQTPVLSEEDPKR